MTWSPPDNETDLYYSRLPFHEAQAKLGETQGDVWYPAVCGWHGTSFDPEKGSVALISTTGVLAVEDFLGERLQIKTAATQYGLDRSVFAYAYNSADMGSGSAVANSIVATTGRSGTTTVASIDSTFYGISGTANYVTALNDGSNVTYVYSQSVAENIVAHLTPIATTGYESLASLTVAYELVATGTIRARFDLKIGSTVLASSGDVFSSGSLTYAPAGGLGFPAANSITLTITTTGSGGSGTQVTVYGVAISWTLTPPTSQGNLQVEGEDISLPRRLFMALGQPSVDYLPVLVSVCPPTA
jgi:hypothetical protein